MNYRLLVWCESALFHEMAQSAANSLGLEFNDVNQTENEILLACDYALVYSDLGAELIWREGKKILRLQVDFVSGTKAHRRKFGGGKSQAVAKAVGVQSRFRPTVLDCTAGQGGDAFVLATLGCNVKMLERNPLAYLLLDDALRRAKLAGCDDAQLESIVQNISLSDASSHQYLEQCTAKKHSYDVVYLDPMFPARNKSAQVKKEMRVFHDLVGKDDDASLLLPLALKVARYRVVVKRPKGAPFLNEQTPSYQLDGKSTRFDVYTIKAIPNKTPI